MPQLFSKYRFSDSRYHKDCRYLDTPGCFKLLKSAFAKICFTASTSKALESNFSSHFISRWTLDLQNQALRSAKRLPGIEFFPLNPNHLSADLSISPPNRIPFLIKTRIYFCRGIVWQIILFVVGCLLVFSVLWARYDTHTFAISNQRLASPLF